MGHVQKSHDESIVLKEAGFKKRVAFVNSAIRLPVAFIGFR